MSNSNQAAESLLIMIECFNYKKYLSRLPPKEMEKVLQRRLDAIQRDKERDERELAERLVIPHDIDITSHGFTSYEEADRKWHHARSVAEYEVDPVEDVKSWLHICRENFLKNQEIENRKKIQRELYELQVRSQELEKWQLEREEERGVRVKISKRKRLLMWLKRG